MKLPSKPASTHRERALNILLWSLLLVSVALLWLAPLSSSFWIDEIATAFFVRNGPSHPSLAALPQMRTSIYYLLPRLTTALAGSSEVAYRLPSVLALAAALFLIARLAARLIHPDASWFAVFACLTLRGFNYQAADARPYALGTAVAAASFLFLIRWLDSARWVDGAAFVLFAALLWRVHLLFWPLYLVFVVYALFRLIRRDTPVRWSRAAAGFGLLGAALVPVLREALLLLREASAHAMARLPQLGNLESSFKVGLVAGCGIGGWLLSVGWRERTLEPNAERKRASAIRVNRMAPAAVVLIVGWWLWQPVCLFAVSRLTGVSIFLPRYFSVALPGAVLAATAAAGFFIAPSRWRLAAVLMAAAVLFNPGQWRSPWPRHDNSNWRAAARAINQLRLPPGTPVICPSPFLEARAPVWRPDYQLPGVFYSHLEFYPIQGRPYLLPFQPSAEAERFATALTRETLSGSGSFAIYGWGGNTDFWREWFAKQPELASWRQTKLPPFGNVEVVRFESPRTGGSD